MIQSQSFGGPPSDTGSDVKRGEADYGRRHNSGPPPPHRPEAGEHRVHRHDSRDAGSNPALRDWRRPSRGYEVYRRDDRGFKDRWKDRKRWDRPRPRDTLRDNHRENIRDPSRDGLSDYVASRDRRDSARDGPRDSLHPPPEFNRSRITYDDDRREERRRPSFQRPETRQASQPQRQVPSDLAFRRESYGETRAPKKFSKRPGEKFRDLMMGTDKTVRPSDFKASNGEPKSLENYSSYRAAKASVRESSPGDSYKEVSPFSGVENLEDHAEEKSKRPIDETTETAAAKPPVDAAAKHSKKLAEQPAAEELKEEHAKEPRNDQSSGTNSRMAAARLPEANSTDESSNTPSETLNGSRLGSSEKKKPADEPTASIPSKKRTLEPPAELTVKPSVQKDQSTDGGDVVKGSSSKSNGGAAHGKNDRDQDPESSLLPSSQPRSPTVNGHSASQDVTKATLSTVKNEGTTTSSTAQSDPPQSTAESIPQSPAPYSTEETEVHADRMDIDTPDSLGSDTRLSSAMDVEELPIDSKPTMLPQELTFHNKLLVDFAEISKKVEPGNYVPRTWSIPSPNKYVTTAISKNENHLKALVEARRSEFKDRKKKWLEFTAVLDNESGGDSEESPQGSKASSVSSTQLPNSHVRRRSKEEEGGASATTRRNRDRHNRGHGDVARSEAEFLEILANLEAQTARDPLVRARLTSARIPDQSQTPFEQRFCSTNALVVDHKILLKRLKMDAVDTFTEEQHVKFIDAYVQWPKQFGRIADAVGRSFNDCVMHYYRTKKWADYKRVLVQRTKKKRGRKPRKRVEDESIPSTPLVTSAQSTQTPDTPNEAEPEPEVVSPAKSKVSTPGETKSTGDEMVVEPASDVAAVSKDTHQGLLNHLEQAVNQAAPEPNSALPNMPSQISGESVTQVALQPALSVPVPPPVLPLHQMDTLATAALSGKSSWTRSEIDLFENLLAAHGSQFHEIAEKLGKPVEAIHAYFLEHQSRYEDIRRQVDTRKVDTALLGSQAVYPLANAYAIVSGGVPEVMNAPPSGIFVPRSSKRKAPSSRSVPQVLPPVVQPPAADTQHSIPQNNVLPPPVLPLQPDHEKVVSEPLPTTNRDPMLPTPSPPMETPNCKQKGFNSSSWDNSIPVTPTIPPILPVSIRGKDFLNAFHNKLLASPFSGFNESNERH